MATYSYESIVKDLRAKKLAPVYFFSGEESFYAQQLLEVIEKEVIG
jgi:DNA polymerase-3 subunit delta